MPCALGYLLLIADRTAPSSGIKSSCEAKEVAEGQKGEIVCNFEVDISKLMQDFEVLHFTVNILNCFWFDNTKKCYTQPGYEYENEISTELIIKIPVVKKDHAGQYSCLVVPSEPEEIQPCNLNVTDFEEAAFTSTVYSTYSNSTRDIGHEQSVDGEYVYIIPIVLGSALLMSSLIFIFLLSTRFTDKLDDWIKIRRTNILCSGSTQNRVEESPRESEETEACL